MPRVLRAEQFDPAEVCIVHCVQRCVRRAYLAGVDAVSGKNYEFRREWIRQRMERLASVFGIDILTYAILSNHMHIVIRTRPDVVETWSDEELALRWLRIFPGRRLDEHLGDPTATDVQALVTNQKRLKLIRLRMSDPSWFMRALSEPIARLANRQDECTGSFWEGRFKAQRITDEAGLLACSMYVDLNPVRAAMAETPEKSVHTSAFDRIEAMKGTTIPSSAAERVVISQAEASEKLKKLSPAKLRQLQQDAKKRRGKLILRDAWLAPLTLKGRGSTDAQPNQRGVRASNKGFLSMSLQDYLALLDWTGKQGRIDKRGKIPSHLQPILKRLGIDSQMWCDLVWSFKKYFGGSSSAGSPSSLRARAAERDRHWTRGQRSASACFESA
jgi:hypothetical protein